MPASNFSASCAGGWPSALFPAEGRLQSEQAGRKVKVCRAVATTAEERGPCLPSTVQRLSLLGTQLALTLHPQPRILFCRLHVGNGTLSGAFAVLQAACEGRQAAKAGRLRECG